jgi:hypothetical protein
MKSDVKNWVFTLMVGNFILRKTDYGWENGINEKENLE